MKGCKLEYSTYNPKRNLFITWKQELTPCTKRAFAKACTSYSHQQIKTESLEMSFISSGQHSKPMKHFTIANPIQGNLQDSVKTELKKRRHFCKAGNSQDILSQVIIWVFEDSGKHEKKSAANVGTCCR